MEALRSSETSANLFQITRHHIPEYLDIFPPNISDYTKLKYVAVVRKRTIPTERLVQPLRVEGVAWSAQRIPTVVTLGFLDRSRDFFIQVAPKLSSRGWVDPVPNPLLVRKSGRAENRTRELWICSQKLWPLGHRGGPPNISTTKYELDWIHEKFHHFGIQRPLVRWKLRDVSEEHISPIVRVEE
jgi:hypothetical protein